MIKLRHCWNCGAEIGYIDDRFYDKGDTCESIECTREARNQDAAEREEAHEQLDHNRGWS